MSDASTNPQPDSADREAATTSATPDGSTSDEQEFQNPETEQDTASGGPAD